MDPFKFINWYFPEMCMTEDNPSQNIINIIRFLSLYTKNKTSDV